MISSDDNGIRVHIMMDDETEGFLSLDTLGVAQDVCRAVLTHEGCPYDVQLSLLLTDDEGIRELNRSFREKDAETDVLSFPAIEWEEAASFDIFEDDPMSEMYFDPEEDALILGDIVINVMRVRSQALEYGHSELREYAFLTAHSMLHLLGYDHEDEESAAVMESKQEKILADLDITRDR